MNLQKNIKLYIFHAIQVEYENERFKENKRVLIRILEIIKCNLANLN